MIASVYGVGINDRKYPSSINKVPTKEYVTWLQMIMRCYSDNYKKKRPTYEGCTVSENFKHYSYFYEWCQNQVGFGEEGYQLDKDILVKGNKIYSEDMCVFIPNEINSCVISCTSKRGSSPIGVYFDKNSKRFIAKCSNGFKQIKLGSFNDEYEAFTCYKNYKENHFKILAEKYRNTIDERVFDSLISRSVSILD